MHLRLLLNQHLRHMSRLWQHASTVVTKQHRRHMSRLCQHASTVVTKATSTSQIALMSTCIYNCNLSSIDVTGRAYGNTHLRLLLKQHRRHRSRLCQHASTIIT